MSGRAPAAFAAVRRSGDGELASQEAVPPEVVAPPPEEALAAIADNSTWWSRSTKSNPTRRRRTAWTILEDMPRLARSGSEAMEDGDRERLKWAGSSVVDAGADP